MLRVHPRRATDALQLAAAFVAAERRPSTLVLVTLDERLRTAGKEGFHLADLAPSPSLRARTTALLRALPEAILR